MNKPLFLFSALLFYAVTSVMAVSAHAALTVSDEWRLETSNDGTIATARHEAASVVVGDYIYLIGGRGNRPVERYSTVNGQWENLGNAPVELHHLQPVVIGTNIYIVGAFTCCYPREQAVAEIYVFDTQSLTWDVEGSIPSTRLRGSAAAVVKDDRIYLLGGNTQGHDGGAVAWFDEFDPATGQWRELPDAPHARDHFAAVLVNQRLIAAAGRQSALPNPSANAVAQTDIYDFDRGQWRSVGLIPTPRGGAVAVGYGDNVIVAGGEINTANTALDVVESFDLNTETWQSLPPMLEGRHGAGGGIVSARFHMISGASSLGGAQETASHEMLQLPEITALPQGTSKGGSVELFSLCVLLLGLTRVYFQTTAQRLAES
ncbi:MAG: Kelch repeat-containing protein [Granulosicoccus sp.]